MMGEEKFDGKYAHVTERSPFCEGGCAFLRDRGAAYVIVILTLFTRISPFPSRSCLTCLFSYTLIISVSCLSSSVPLSPLIPHYISSALYVSYIHEDSLIFNTLTALPVYLP